MSKQTKRLARGLDSLLSSATTPTTLPTEVATVAAPAQPGGRATRSNLDALLLTPQSLTPNPFQPRRGTNAEGVARLADSLRESGMLQPIVARRSGDELQIIAGERRWRAAIAAKLERVPVLVRGATDEEMLAMALVENIQREDLNAIDRARAYRRLQEEFGLSPEQVGKHVGEDRTTVTNYLRLLELPAEVTKLVSGGGISAGHARCLLGIARPDRQVELARAAKENEISVRALEEIVRREKTERAKAATVGTTKEKSAHVADLERRFEAALSLRVMIRPSRQGNRGRVIIEYNSLDDFDRVAGALGVEVE